MPPMYSKPNLTGVAGNVRAGFPNIPHLLNTPAAASARTKAQQALNRISASPIAASPIGQAFQQYLRERLARGEDMEEFLKELHEKACQEIGKRKHIVLNLVEALNLFRGGDTLHRVRNEVIQAAKSGQLTGEQAWERLSKILNTPYPFLTWMGQRVGPFNIGLSVQVKGGMGVGVGYGEGISGLRYCLACFFQQVSVCAGAVADADIGLQLSVSEGSPSGGISFSVEVGGGGGEGATVGASASFTPFPRRPTIQDPRIFDYEFSGVSVGLGGGGGLDVSVAFGITESRILGGQLS
jgi:hypothetical protein